MEFGNLPFILCQRSYRNVVMSCCHFLPQSTGDSLDDDDDDDDNMNHETKKNTTFNEGTASHSHSHLHHHTHHAFEVSPVVAFPSILLLHVGVEVLFVGQYTTVIIAIKNQSFMASCLVRVHAQGGIDKGIH